MWQRAVRRDIDASAYRGGKQRRDGGQTHRTGRPTDAMPSRADDEKPLSRKPANTAFKQQRLKAWQPLLTPKTVLPTFFLIGAIFVPLGIVLYLASNGIVEVVFDYTQCSSVATTTLAAPIVAGTNIKKWSYNPTSKVCQIQFDIPSSVSAPVFMYYRLTNFFQNNRRYVKSFDASQLLGYVEASKLTSDCDPLRVPKDGDQVWVVDNTGANVTLSNKPAASGPAPQYYPCGLIANSLFSDSIASKLNCIQSDYTFPNNAVCSPTSPTPVVYNFSTTGIAWPTDTNKYGNVASNLGGVTTDQIPTTLIPPPYWRTAFPKWANGYNSTNLPNLQTWEQFQVWMRTAGLPTFRKLWGRNTDSFLPYGTWQIDIVQNFDVSRYSGTKSIVISSVSLLGGKNTFLGVAYIIVGTICWALGIAFLARHMLKPRKLGDHTFLSWNQPPAQQALQVQGSQQH